jgi:hypothetical protein
VSAAFNYEQAKANTEVALLDPRVGDRFHEMYSFWCYVVAVEGDMVTTMEASPPCSFPEDGKIKTMSKAELVQRFCLSFHGPWVMLADRDNDVSGWLEKQQEKPLRAERRATLKPLDQVSDIPSANRQAAPPSNTPGRSRPPVTSKVSPATTKPSSATICSRNV